MILRSIAWLCYNSPKTLQRVGAVMIGASIDHFRILKSVEESVVGETFFAAHKDTGQKFYLTGINQRLLTQSGFRRHFLDDSVKIIKLNHPSIISTANVIEEKGRLFLVRPFVEGQLLADLLRDEGSIPHSHAVHLMNDLVSGVHYAHEQGQIHRFLNPKNIVVTPEGGARLMGFGKVLQQAEEMLLGSDHLGYQARYFSPERFRNPDTTDPRANIYALGVILFEILTGHPPYPETQFATQAKRHMEMAVPDPCAVVPDIPAGLVEVISRAMGKRPEDRFQNCNEMALALSPFGGTGDSQAPIAAEGLGPAGDDFGFELPSEQSQFDFGVAEDPAGLRDEFSLASEEEGDFALGEGGAWDAGLDQTFSEKTSEPSDFSGLQDSAPQEEFGTGSVLGDSGSGLDFDLGSGGLDDGMPDFGSIDLGDEANTNQTGQLDLDNLGFGNNDNAATPDDGMDWAAKDADATNFGEPSGEPELGFGQDFDLGTSGEDLGGGLGFGDDAGSDFNLGSDLDLDGGAPADDGHGMDNDFSNMENAFDGPAPGEPGYDFQLGNEPEPTAAFDLGTSAGDGAGALPNFDLGSDASSDFNLGGDLEPPPSSEPFGSNFPMEGGGFSLGDDPGASGGDFSLGSDLGGEAPADVGFSLSDSPEIGGFPEKEPAADPNQGFTLGDTPDGDGAGFDLGGTEETFAVGGDSPFAMPDENEAITHGGESIFGDDDSAFEMPEDGALELEAPDPSETFSAPEMPATDNAEVGDALTTDDGAFSFEAVDDDDLPEMDVDVPPPPAATPGQKSSAATGLKKSLGDIQKSSPRPQLVSVKRVQRVDPKIIALIAGLAALVLVAFSYWFFSSRNRAKQETILQNIQSMVDRKQYDQALGAITGEISGEPNTQFERALLQIQTRVQKEIQDRKNQINTLLARAAGFEVESRFLIDGKNDAYGVYKTVLSIDETNDAAKAAIGMIRAQQLELVEKNLEEGTELAALKILSGLAKADRKDKEVNQRFDALKTRLRDEKSEDLQQKMDQLFAASKYEAMIPLLEELGEIDPKSDYVRQQRKSLFEAFLKRGQDAQSRRKFEQAIAAYEAAARIDPENEKIQALQDDLKEEALRINIEKVAFDLESAINRKNFPQQFRLINRLNELDPGNGTAGVALENVRKEVARLRGEAELKTQTGRYRDAADLYSKIFQINQDEDARRLWKKFQAWTPPKGMAYIPPGEWKIGSNTGADTRPKRPVFISGFFIDKYEVTNRDYEAFTNANPKWKPGRVGQALQDGNYLKHWEKGRPHPDDLDRPVIFVSWHAAMAYAKWKGHRLPTEAEWEKAAAGNKKDQKYWWGNYSTAKMAVYEFYPEKMPAPVGKFPANGFGLYEILGNVNEWVQDTYDPGFYARTDGAQDPVNLEPNGERVNRGGSFRSQGKDLTLYLRFHNDPRICHPTIGFRTAKSSTFNP